MYKCHKIEKSLKFIKKNYLENKYKNRSRSFSMQFCFNFKKFDYYKICFLFS